MKGEKVIIKSTGEIKTINEYESINGVEIFYMSDNTSYSSDSFEFPKQNNLPEEFLIDSQVIIKSICLSKKVNESTDNFIMSLCDSSLSKRKFSRKEKKTKTIKIFGWTITLTKSK